MRPAHDVIRRAGAFNILVRGLDAEVEYLRDLPIRLPRGKQAEALKLASAEMRMSGLRRIIVQPPRDAKGVGADEFGIEQPVAGKTSAVAHGERAGAARLPRNVDWYREALADAVAPAPLQYPALRRCKGQQRTEFGPAEADVRSDAGMVDWIDMGEVLPDQFPLPVRRVIVDAN